MEIQVFVDATGRRARRLRAVAALAAVIALLVLGALVDGAVGAGHLPRITHRSAPIAVTYPVELPAA